MPCIALPLTLPPIHQKKHYWRIEDGRLSRNPCIKRWKGSFQSWRAVFVVVKCKMTVLWDWLDLYV